MEAPRTLALASGLLALAALAAPLAQAQAPDLGLYAYHTYETLQADLERLAATYPEHARLQSIGQSHQGRDLWTLEIGTFAERGYDERPAFYLDGGHHGNEHLGIEAAYLFAEQLLVHHEDDPATKALVDAHRVFVTPLVNPDGKAANTRQNGMLVNLNRNYPFHWDERGTDPQPGGANYAGPSAASEPETQANMRFIEALGPSVYVSLHTGSYDIVRPFGYAPDEPVPDEALYQQLSAWADETVGLESRYPGGSGESICWAYGAQGVFSVLFEVYEQELRPAGGPQVLFGPVPKADVLAVLDPHLQSFRHLLENTVKWGAHVRASIADVRGSDATLVLVNEGFAPARGIAVVGTGLEVRGPVPPELAPGAEARVPVRLDAPSQAYVRYQRLAVEAEDPAATLAAAEALVEFRTSGIEPRAAPGAEGPALLAALALVALAARRR